MSNKLSIVISLAFAALAGCDHREAYEEVYSVYIQTFLDRATLLSGVKAEAARRGFSEHPRTIKESGYGVNLFKNGQDIIFQFEGTEGISCYRLAVFAKDKKIAKEISDMSHEMIEVITAKLGDELHYLGSGLCPNVTHSNAAQSDPVKPRAWP